MDLKKTKTKNKIENIDLAILVDESKEVGVSE